MKTLGTLALSLAIAFAAAPAARADVYVLDILSRKAGVSSHEAAGYNGALSLIAHRYGGVRVSTFHESSVAGEPGTRLVGLWRFPDARAVEALLADPNYAQIVRLRDRSFEHGESSTLSLVADHSTSPPTP
jgi:uncharacterized protein (DUF1330 family)